MTRNRQTVGTIFPRGKAGFYYWRYIVDGKVTTSRLLDENGNRITERRKAEAAQRKASEVFLLGNKAAQQAVILAEIDGTKEKQRHAMPPLPLAKVWPYFNKSRHRPKNIADSTLNRYHAVIDAFIKFLEENFTGLEYFPEVTEEHAEAYAASLEAAHVSPSTFNIYLNALSKVWKIIAKEEGIGGLDPFAYDKTTMHGIKRKSTRKEAGARSKEPLTLNELAEVIKKAEGDYKSLCIILACTGQRLVDACLLKWEEVNLLDGTITLIPQKTARRTGRRVYIPILPPLRAELEELHHDSPFVLPAIAATYERDKSAVTKQMRKLFIKAKLTPEKKTHLSTAKAIVSKGAHSFRYSFVTLARIAGIRDGTIQKITGHETVEMVDKYDASFNEEEISKLAGTLTLGTLAAPKPKREPLPKWALERITALDADNWNQIKTELMKEIAQ